MIYRGIILSLFLAPAAMTGNNTKNAQIQELEEKAYQKELEVSNLGNMIAQREELLSKQKLDLQNSIDLLINERIELLEKQNGGKLLSQADKNKVDTETRKKAKEFFYKFMEIANDGKEISGMLTSSLFEDETNGQLVKFYFVRLVLDQQVIFNLIEKYETCIKESYALWNELQDLQKKHDMQLN